MYGCRRMHAVSLGVILGFGIIVNLTNAVATKFPTCVERSPCYHSTDCCKGCCEDNQCVPGSSPCSDHNVARNCSTLVCTPEQECEQENRFCLIAPCPQPLPECVPKKETVPEKQVPLPVKYD